MYFIHAHMQTHTSTYLTGLCVSMQQNNYIKLIYKYVCECVRVRVKSVNVNVYIKTIIYIYIYLHIDIYNVYI